MPSNCLIRLVETSAMTTRFVIHSTERNTAICGGDALRRTRAIFVLPGISCMLAFRPRQISWWVVSINFAGCIGFMVSAIFAVVIPGPPHPTWGFISLALTLQGALSFFAGAVLMIPETMLSRNGRPALALTIHDQDRVIQGID